MIKPDEIIRSNRKTLAISIDRFSRLTVRAPFTCGEERIFAFLQQKENWILRQKSKATGAGMRLPPENLDGYEFLLLGKTRKVVLTDGNKIGLDEEKGLLFLPRKNARDRLVKWLKENAKRIFANVTEQKAKEMGLTFASVSVGSAKKRWGSCNANREIHYTFRLLYAPKEVVEYVIVHELAHIRHMNHSKAFWQEVTKFCPDWKNRRAWLKNNSIVLEIF